MLPIIQGSGRVGAFAGLVSDGSLLDVLTVTNRDAANDNGVGFRAGTVVVIDSIMGANYRGFVPASFAEIAGKTCGAALFSHYEMNSAAISMITLNELYRQRPCNVATTCRAWLFCDPSGITPESLVTVGQFKVDGVNQLSGVVKKASGENIPGWFFTGRVEKDANGFSVAEVQVRPQTAAPAAAGGDGEGEGS